MHEARSLLSLSVGTFVMWPINTTGAALQWSGWLNIYISGCMPGGVHFTIHQTEVERLYGEEDGRRLGKVQTVLQGYNLSIVLQVKAAFQTDVMPVLQKGSVFKACTDKNLFITISKS